jgi:hypothetical protein
MSSLVLLSEVTDEARIGALHGMLGLADGARSQLQVLGVPLRNSQTTVCASADDWRLTPQKSADAPIEYRHLQDAWDGCPYPQKSGGRVR